MLLIRWHKWNKSDHRAKENNNFNRKLYSVRSDSIFSATKQKKLKNQKYREGGHRVWDCKKCKWRKKKTYRVRIGTEQVNGSLHKLVPWSYVNHWSEETARFTKIFDDFGAVVGANRVQSSRTDSQHGLFMVEWWAQLAQHKKNLMYVMVARPKRYRSGEPGPSTALILFFICLMLKCCPCF